MKGMNDHVGLLNGRIREAMQAYAQRTGATSHAKFGAAIAEHEQRQNPYTPDEVYAWINGSDLPSLSTLRAIAGLVGEEDMEYFAFGNEGNIHELEDGDYDRVHNRRRR